MRARALPAAVAVAVALAACLGCGGTQAQSPQLHQVVYPDWVTRGTTIFVDGAHRGFYGVGVASGRQDKVRGFGTADGRARVEVAKALEGYLASLIKHDPANGSEPSFASEEPPPESKEVIALLVAAARLTERWSCPDPYTSGSTSYFSLVTLDLHLECGQERRRAARDSLAIIRAARTGEGLRHHGREGTHAAGTR